MPVHIDISVSEDRWGDVSQWAPLAEQCIATTTQRLDMDQADSEVSILMTDDAAIQEMNAHYRGQDKPTNVLSFPAIAGIKTGVLPPLLGDIVLAFETISREAQIEGKPLEHHVAHLIIHGFLHLLGYDHETDAQAREMEAMESLILGELNIDDPYRD
ncbi:MAG: rRNA maturation RNase YbeY [Pseudomonadota bacterium]